MQRSLDTSLDLLFNARSIALVGASNKPGKMGNLFAQRLCNGFRGDFYPINPNESEVVGVKCYSSVSALPEPVDVLIALVPGTELMRLVESGTEKFAHFLIAIPSGFAEVSDRGRELQAQLIEAAHSRGMKVIGPNSVGYMNCETGLNASMIPLVPPGGRGVAYLTQSGGFGMALAMYAADHGMHVAKFCDVGNMSDIDINSVLCYLGDDPSTAIVGLFLEAVKDIESFLATLEQVARHKPVVMSAVGLSQAGVASSRAHLGLDPNLGSIRGALPEGAHFADTGLELMDACKAILWQQRPIGRRLAIITGTGGIGSELADLVTAEHIEVPALSTALQKQLRAHLPDYASVGNPIDVTPIWWQYPDVYPQLIKLLDASGEVDMILVSITDVATTLPALTEAIAAVQKSCLRTSLCVYWGSRAQDLGAMLPLQQALIPCYSTTRAAAKAVAALSQTRAQPGASLAQSDL